MQQNVDTDDGSISDNDPQSWLSWLESSDNNFAALQLAEPRAIVPTSKRHNIIYHDEVGVGTFASVYKVHFVGAVVQAGENRDRLFDRSSTRTTHSVESDSSHDADLQTPNQAVPGEVDILELRGPLRWSTHPLYHTQESRSPSKPEHHYALKKINPGKIKSRSELDHRINGMKCEALLLSEILVSQRGQSHYNIFDIRVPIRNIR
jgi:hypothetical protein